MPRFWESLIIQSHLPEIPVSALNNSTFIYQTDISNDGRERHEVFTVMLCLILRYSDIRKRAFDLIRSSILKRKKKNAWRNPTKPGLSVWNVNGVIHQEFYQVGCISSPECINKRKNSCTYVSTYFLKPLYVCILRIYFLYICAPNFLCILFLLTYLLVSIFYASLYLYPSISSVCVSVWKNI